MDIKLTGRIDSDNAAAVEKRIFSLLADGEEARLDASDLTYISSAGLRVLLRVSKAHPDLRIVNVGNDVYEILEMTGFTEIMKVEKVYKTVSIEGCEEVGRGANGTIYRLDKDTVVKVYKNPDALPEIQNEREMAKLALILGVPTAISYSVVRVGSGYGAVFELLNASSFSKILAEQPEKFDWCVKEYAGMLKKIHEIEVPEGRLADVQADMIERAGFIQPYLPEASGKKLLSLVEAVPHDSFLIHGDYHPKNLELQNGEVLLIDMDTLGAGNPIFEFGSIFNAFIGFSELDHSIFRQFQGFDFETGYAFWRKALAAYLGTSCESKIDELETKASILGYMRMLRRAVLRGELETEPGKQAFAFRRRRLIERLDAVDSLAIAANELTVGASLANLAEVQQFICERLSSVDCPEKTQMQTALVVEEVFVNVADYAYEPGKGKVTVCVDVAKDPAVLTLTFVDSGRPFDPLQKADPDVTLPAEQRNVGGLGIFLTKKLMDDVRYEYRDGQNVLTLTKNL
ncbi:MAG: ATP-binding protein [Clostridia bacterium]|nr:ATP-binding protein [Clostridia bacterium]